MNPISTQPIAITRHSHSSRAILCLCALALPTLPATAIPEHSAITTLDEMIVPTALPSPATPLVPQQVSEYASYGYGLWSWDSSSQIPAGFHYLRPDPTMVTDDVVLSVRDPLATTLLTFFTISDVHITDKESPAQVIYLSENFPDPKTPAPQSLPLGNSSAYSAVMLTTTHVLDAAVQTINTLHRTTPFDCGIALGDAANNTQRNELRWYIDVLDGKWISPSSGAHVGDPAIDYQASYQAAGLDKSIPWYQTVGNHDQFWMGSSPVTHALRKTYVGSTVLNMAVDQITSLPIDFSAVLNTGNDYMGLVDGLSPFGDIIHDGPRNTPPVVTPDPNRRSLALKQWMSEFRQTTTHPVGHGFTEKMIGDEFACYHFHPRAEVPIKVIVLDDTDKISGGAAAALDSKRYNWLVKELDEGERNDELMIICAHIPLRPYATPGSPNPIYPLWSLWSPASPIAEKTLIDKLHTYKNLVLWLSGHVHRNTITPQLADDGDPEYSFWEVETPSLRDFPQQFRRFEITRNANHTISIFALDVDLALAAPIVGQPPSPAWKSRSYAIASQQIYGNPIAQGPNVDPRTGVYNAELIKQVSATMQNKLALLAPRVSACRVRKTSPSSAIVTLENTVTGSTPIHYMASESKNFISATWLAYSKHPSFSLSSAQGKKTIYFKVKDGSGTSFPVVRKQFTL